LLTRPKRQEALSRAYASAKTTVRIAIPRENVFSVPGLQGIFQRLGSGGEP
jgi:hypothetical protein